MRKRESRSLKEDKKSGVRISLIFMVKRITARTFEDLLVWRKAHEFVLSVYRFTISFPNHEFYGLTSQLRRPAISIPANIAEGFKKRGKFDKARFMKIAQGSVEEYRYYLILAQDFGYGEIEAFMATLEEVSRLLEACTKSILVSKS